MNRLPDPAAELRALYRRGHGCARDVEAAAQLLAALCRRRELATVRAAVLAFRERWGWPARDAMLARLEDAWPPVREEAAGAKRWAALAELQAQRI